MKKSKKIEEILKLIEESFDEQIYSDCCDTGECLESRINGKEEFLDELKEKLSKIIKDK